MTTANNIKTKQLVLTTVWRNGGCSASYDINWDRFDIEITEHPSNKVRTIYVKNVKNMANICQFKLTSCKRLAELIYNYGIGQSTGSGFGTIYKTENHEHYYEK
jgi:CRISPR-associated endoribonuclease Cas6